MINKYRYIKLGLLLITIATTMVSCNAQQDSSINKSYEPYTEHQYYIKPENDTLLLYLFKITMSKEDIDNSQNGKVFLEIDIDTAGNVIEVIFKKIDKVVLTEHAKRNLFIKMKDELKYEVTEDAKNYYAILGKPIRINHTILIKNLIDKDK